MKISIVLGTQFGDEGKGSFTNHLCKKDESSLVIRFNGGHQAGHTVLHETIRHTFSSFGSGTFKNVPTYWSKYCTIYPIALINEYNILNEKGITPEIYIDPLCPVTTPYDILANINNENKNSHGSVGVGFGTTIQRQESYYKLYYQDLFNDVILEGKMFNIKQYYNKIHFENLSIIDEMLNNWYDAIKKLRKLNFTKNLYDILYYDLDHIIFEGAQGILLDMDFGFFPNVTRSNTTCKNALSLINSLGLVSENINVYYITRAYQTRHGMGYMTNRELKLELINTEHEINVDTSFQGIFRKSILDLDLLQYAIQSDDRIQHDYSIPLNKNIVITCLDQIKGNIKYTFNKKLYEGDIQDMKSHLSKITKINNFILGETEGKFNKRINNII